MCKVLWAAVWVSDQCSLAGASGFCPSKLYQSQSCHYQFPWAGWLWTMVIVLGTVSVCSVPLESKFLSFLNPSTLLPSRVKSVHFLNGVTAVASSLTLSADFSLTGVSPCSCMCEKFGKGSGCQMCSCFTAVLAVKFQGAWAEKPSFVRGLESFFSPSFPWQAGTCTRSSSSATCPAEVGE